MNLHDLMRRLWTDHVLWTRQVIVSALAGLPDLDAALARLLRNQDELGAAMGRFFGSTAGRQVATLLREHINIAVLIVMAARAGNMSAVESLSRAWRQNADRIADALAALNPQWQAPALRRMLYDHLNLTTAEVVLRLQQRWRADVDNFDRILSQALMMADALSNGIAARFGSGRR